MSRPIATITPAEASLIADLESAARRHADRREDGPAEQCDRIRVTLLALLAGRAADRAELARLRSAEYNRAHPHPLRRKPA